MLVETDEHNSHTVNPEACRLVGKDCRSCVADSANIVALLCPNLDAASAQKMFFSLYRHSGCGPAARSFVREYLAAVEPAVAEENWPVPSANPFIQIAACA